MTLSNPNEIAIEGLKATPAALGAVASSITLNEWVGVVTIIYVVAQAIYLFWKAHCERKERALSQAYQLRREQREILLMERQALQVEEMKIDYLAMQNFMRERDELSIK